MKNGKKLLSLLLALVLVLALLPAQGFAATSGTCGSNVTWSLQNGVLAISGTGAMENYDVKDGTPAPWVDQCGAITSAVISSGITNVGDWAFYNCSALTSVAIPDSVTAIGWQAFHGCTSLVNMTVPSGVTSIDDFAFTGCKSLTSVTIPDGVTKIGFGVFAGCTGLTSMTIPDGVTSINSSAFEGCAGLTSVTIPSSVTSIINGAFFGCTALKDVYYGGTEAQWKSIEIEKNNECLTNATIHFGADQPAAGGPTLADLSYSFGNSRGAYGYSKPYRIPLSRYQLVFGETELAQKLYDKTGSWGGNCGGMSSTSCFFYLTNNNISPNSFKSGASRPSDLSVKNRNSAWDLSLTEFIEAMQIAQSSDVIQNAYWEDNAGLLNQLCDAVLSFHQTGEEPVIIAIYGSAKNTKTGKEEQTGHAVVGYDIVDVSETESHLMVYDPNFPETERYITLTKKPSGRYNSWYYKHNETYDWGTGKKDSAITYATCSDFLKVWETRGETENNKNLLNVNIPNAAIKDEDGTVIATIRDGVVVTERKDIYPLINVGLTLDGDSAEMNGYSLWLPSDGLYTVENTDSSVRDFEAVMVNVDQSATVNTTSSEITFAVNDTQKVTYAKLGEGSEGSYTLTLRSTLDDGYGNVELKGTASKDSTPVLAQISGKLYAQDVDLGSDASLRVDGAEKTESILAGELPRIPLLDGTMVSFTDVPSGSWYHDAVYWAVEKGITAGTGTNPPTFTPERTCTETEILTFLWRAAGQPASTAKLPFTPKNSWASDALRWAFEKGMIGASFNESAPCTRASTAKFIWQAAGSPAASGTASFTDVPAGADYAQAVAWAVKQGITQGTGDAAFSPNATCTRAEIVTFLHRAY